MTRRRRPAHLIALAWLACVGGTALAASASSVACRGGGAVPRPARAHCLAARGLRLSVGGHALSVLWSGRYPRSGRGGWTAFQAVAGGIRRVRAPRIGGPAAMFTVRPGDVPTPSGERSEAVASQRAVAGDPGRQLWYAWSVYFPRDFRPVPRQTWNIFTQWHESAPDECHPNVAFEVDTVQVPARIRLDVRGGWLDPRTCARQSDHAWNLIPLVTGHWYDIVFHVRWSADPGRGFVELYIDGRRVLPHTSVATLYRGQGVYLKQGFYRAPFSGTSRVFEGGMSRF